MMEEDKSDEAACSGRRRRRTSAFFFSRSPHQRAHAQPTNNRNATQYPFVQHKLAQTLVLSLPRARDATLGPTSRQVLSVAGFPPDPRTPPSALSRSQKPSEPRPTDGKYPHLLPSASTSRSLCYTCASEQQYHGVITASADGDPPPPPPRLPRPPPPNPRPRQRLQPLRRPLRLRPLPQHRRLPKAAAQTRVLLWWWQRPSAGRLPSSARRQRDRFNLFPLRRAQGQRARRRADAVSLSARV